MNLDTYQCKFRFQVFGFEVEPTGWYVAVKKDDPEKRKFNVLGGIVLDEVRFIKADGEVVVHYKKGIELNFSPQELMITDLRTRSVIMFSSLDPDSILTSEISNEIYYLKQIQQRIV